MVLRGFAQFGEHITFVGAKQSFGGVEQRVHSLCGVVRIVEQGGRHRWLDLMMTQMSMRAQISIRNDFSRLGPSLIDLQQGQRAALVLFQMGNFS